MSSTKLLHASNALKLPYPAFLDSYLLLSYSGNDMIRGSLYLALKINDLTNQVRIRDVINATGNCQNLSDLQIAMGLTLQ